MIPTNEMKKFGNPKSSDSNAIYTSTTKSSATAQNNYIDMNSTNQPSESLLTQATNQPSKSFSKRATDKIFRDAIRVNTFWAISVIMLLMNSIVMIVLYMNMNMNMKALASHFEELIESVLSPLVNSTQEELSQFDALNR